MEHSCDAFYVSQNSQNHLMRKDFHFQCNLKARRGNWHYFFVGWCRFYLRSLTSIYIIVMLIVGIICSVMLFECFLMRDLIIVVNMLVVLLRVLVKVNMVLGAWEIWAALWLFLNEYATSRRWIRLCASKMKKIMHLREWEMARERKVEKDVLTTSFFSFLLLHTALPPLFPFDFNSHHTWSLHTRRTQTKLRLEHLQTRHGSLLGTIDVSANIVLLWRHPDTINCE